MTQQVQPNPAAPAAPAAPANWPAGWNLPPPPAPAPAAGGKPPAQQKKKKKKKERAPAPMPVTREVSPPKLLVKEKPQKFKRQRPQQQPQRTEGGEQWSRDSGRDDRSSRRRRSHSRSRDRGRGGGGGGGPRG